MPVKNPINECFPTINVGISQAQHFVKFIYAKGIPFYSHKAYKRVNYLTEYGKYKLDKIKGSKRVLLFTAMGSLKGQNLSRLSPLATSTY
ncbi:MAG: hypothetical protein M0D57_02310 [Sphingobacteriales bacterium JAD_PAG50586_3]|nr:MAG: hypothetical protein M0D57_02310 [Sphingobacteriales bacterium JAD_PAG50586_3]